MRVKWNSVGRVANGMLETIGRTPLVDLKSIPHSEGIKARILVKLEYMNPTGSLRPYIL